MAHNNSNEKNQWRVIHIYLVASYRMPDMYSISELMVQSEKG